MRPWKFSENELGKAANLFDFVGMKGDITMGIKRILKTAEEGRKKRIEEEIIF
ncbi:MAG: hypothetical protein QXH27_05795 [Candidatus Micrarchaeia archaeon]